MGWKRMKGMVKATNRCPKCRGEYPDEEYDNENDLCLWCLFPQAQKSLSAELDDTGRNETYERKMLDELDYIPEKQSAAAKKSYKAFKERNYLKPKSL